MKSDSKLPILLIILISIPIFIGALDLTVVSAVLPHVIMDLEIPLQTGLDNAAWMVTGYLLAYSISMTFMGRLSDLIGRKKVFLWALGIFMLGSYLVAVSDGWPTNLALRIYYMFANGRPDISFVTLDVLIISRMIQAFGAGTMVPVGMAVVSDLYPSGKRAKPLGIIAAVDTTGWVVGHLYGGIIVKSWDWRVIFWLNIPICLIAFGLIYFMMKSKEEVRSAGKMDWIGAGLIALSLTLLNIGLGSGSDTSTSSKFGESGGLSEYLVPLLVSALIFFILFIWRQRTAKYPLIKLSLFKRKNILPANIANLLVGISLFIAIANVPIFINSLVAETVEQGAWDSGWMLSALTVPMAFAAVPGGWLTERKGYRIPSIFGLVLAITGFILMSTWTAETQYLTMIPHLILTGIGFGMTMAPISAAVINSSPEGHRGTSSALVILFRLVGMTIGVSGITTYDLRRAEALNLSLISDNSPISEIVQTGLQVIEQVISETFLIAGAIIVLAILLMLLLRTPNEGSKNYD